MSKWITKKSKSKRDNAEGRNFQSVANNFREILRNVSSDIKREIKTVLKWTKSSWLFAQNESKSGVKRARPKRLGEFFLICVAITQLHW